MVGLKLLLVYYFMAGGQFLGHYWIECCEKEKALSDIFDRAFFGWRN